MPVRRSRGQAPAPVRLPRRLAVPTLATGGHLKNTFALGARSAATLSQHLGDLEDRRAVLAYAEAVAHFERLLGVTPRRVVHDLHPDYATTRYAEMRGGELVAVQHHHAHFAACLAEHGSVGPAIGVIFDGSGLGDDGTLWGGEWLVGGAARARRAAHLAPVALPGGDAAARAPWRTAVSHLLAAGIDPATTSLAARVSPGELRAVASVAQSRIAPVTSSVGRLFDAIAALLCAGAADRAGYEGHAAMRLETLAARTAGPVEPFPVVISDGAALRVDPAPIVRAVVDALAAGVPVERIARAFHATLAACVVAVCRVLRDRDRRLEEVALSGGVFVNRILAAEAEEGLTAAGFRVLTHGEVPPGDGGLSLGQLAVVCARDAEEAR